MLRASGKTFGSLMTLHVCSLLKMSSRSQVTSCPFSSCHQVQCFAYPAPGGNFSRVAEAAGDARSPLRAHDPWTWPADVCQGRAAGRMTGGLTGGLREKTPERQAKDWVRSLFSFSILTYTDNFQGFYLMILTEIRRTSKSFLAKSMIAISLSSARQGLSCPQDPSRVSCVAMLCSGSRYHIRCSKADAVLSGDMGGSSRGGG